MSKQQKLTRRDLLTLGVATAASTASGYALDEIPKDAKPVIPPSPEAVEHAMAAVEAAADGKRLPVAEIIELYNQHISAAEPIHEKALAAAQAAFNKDLSLTPREIVAQYLQGVEKRNAEAQQLRHKRHKAFSKEVAGSAHLGVGGGAVGAAVVTADALLRKRKRILRTEPQGDEPDRQR